ncbi:MAG: hypothetical protein CME34_03055 [Gordonia sp.]|uniref:hypothetical protein n=1 Tax=Gordonia sp. (in: high G+C Gram-positive bacteria) TaxID=84139 RepID=UPI000C600B17|nr:hypothetical protein [Gordonia sp. (in: high G+C Gram-positive bacteria)]MAU80848.1 hypothetical protein [Gordonia sp. (in: high G+C Gram-positive bacteria)]
MTDNRWAWVTPDHSDTADRTEATDTSVTDTSAQKLHINSGAGAEALDLWNPHHAAIPAPTAHTPAPSSEPVEDAAPHDVLTDAVPEQFPAAAALPNGDLSQAWTGADAPTEPESDALTVLLADGRRRSVRRRTMRRAAIVAGVVAVTATVVGVVAAAVWPTEPTTSAGRTPVSAWCPVGVDGDVTTVDTGGAADSPQSAVAAFVSALLDQRSPAAARAVMATSAPAPTLGELRTWIAGLPAAQVQWCAQITATESPARLRVTVTGRVGDDGDPQPMSTDTFYVSAPTPTTWVVDAIVAEEGTQP